MRAFYQTDPWQWTIPQWNSHWECMCLLKAYDSGSREAVVEAKNARSATMARYRR